MAAARDTIHGTALVIGGAGVLIRGPSGAGKSDLALRCIGMGPGPLVPCQASLISDDRVEIWRENHYIMMAPPPAIADKLEVRGVGIVDVAGARGPVALILVADLVASLAGIERLPEPDGAELLGVRVARVELYPFEPSAALKLMLAVKDVSGQRRERID